MEVQLEEKNGIRLAIEGCGHGTLHAIYASVAESCKQKNWPGVDLLIIGGDFQSVRNAFDLNCVSMPAKYRSMCDFHEYYAGQRTAPYLTVFVGGNHEASNYLTELYYGGWVAPNIYYLGAANVLRLGPLRIAGLSGIWKGYNYRRPHHERLPYNESEIKSIYHVRELDVRKLSQVSTQVDVGISHDWPKGVQWKGNWKQLFRFKPFLEEDAKAGQLGSVAALQVMDRLRPRTWCSAHLHCKYAAVVQHGKDGGGPDGANGTSAGPKPEVAAASSITAPVEDSSESRNTDEIDLDLDDDAPPTSLAQPTSIDKTANPDELDLELEDDVDGITTVAPGQGLDNTHIPTNGQAPTPLPALDEARAALPESFRRPLRRPEPEPIDHPPDIANKTTHFLALDKCMPNRHFLQLLAIPAFHAEPNVDLDALRPLRLSYDREWLSITRTFALTEPPVFGDPSANVPQIKTQSEYRKLMAEQRAWIDAQLPADSDLVIPENFEVVAPVYDGGDWNLPQYSTVQEFPNPQTERFCQKLGVPNVLAISESDRAERMAAGPRHDPDAERFAAQGGRGRGRGGSGRGRGDRGRGRGGGGKGGGGRGRGRSR